MEKALKALGKSGEPIASSPQPCSSLRSFLALFLGDFVSVRHSKVGTILEERTVRNPTSLEWLSRQPAQDCGRQSSLSLRFSGMVGAVVLSVSGPLHCSYSVTS